MNWAYLEVHPIIRWMGFGLIVVSIPFLAWVHRSLGQYYSYALETKKEQSIVKIGPYARIRHPLYSAHHLFDLGMNLLAAYIPLIVIAILGLPVSYSRMKSEESMMLREFGDEYKDYMNQTGRIIPKLKHSLQS